MFIFSHKAPLYIALVGNYQNSFENSKRSITGQFFCQFPFMFIRGGNLGFGGVRANFLTDLSGPRISVSALQYFHCISGKVISSLSFWKLFNTSMNFTIRVFSFLFLPITASSAQHTLTNSFSTWCLHTSNIHRGLRFSTFPSLPDALTSIFAKLNLHLFSYQVSNLSRYLCIITI